MNENFRPSKENVASKIKEWIKIDQEGTNKTYKNAVGYIESELKRPLSCLETTWFERQYVETLLQLWLENSLEKAFKHLDEESDISNEMSAVLNQLNSINSFGDIRSVLNEEMVKKWCDGECRYLQLIIEQEDLFKNTSCFTVSVNCFFRHFKTSCINRVFSRSLSKDETLSEKHKKFIVDLIKFLCNVNKEKNLQDILEKEEFAVDESSKTPEWLQTLISAANLLNENEWTNPLKALTKEICKILLLPETEIGIKKEDGKQIITIKGVVIFVSKMMNQMMRLKDEYPNVEEIKIVGLKSVHIDSDLDNEIWHGINVEIITDKLIVDGVTDDGYVQTSHGVCWDVSGKNGISNLPRGEPCQPGESGGNVFVACNNIINGQKWTILSEGGDGSAGNKWTKEEFEKCFPSMVDDKEQAIETVLTTLKEILPNEKRRIGQNILPGHKGNFLITGKSDDGSDVTAIFYGENKLKETLILHKRNHIGQGGYGGNITIECFSKNKVNVIGEPTTTSGIPFTGRNISRRPLRTVRMGVYEASGNDGNIDTVTGDVAFIHKTNNGSTNSPGDFYGFEKEEKILIRLNVEKVRAEINNIYVKYEDKKYAKLHVTNYSEKELPVILFDAVKKKTVIRQSLVQQFDQIDERKQLEKSIQEIMSNSTEHRSNLIEDIVNEMENKVQQQHQLMTRRQQHQFEKIEQEQFVKPALESSQSFQKPKIIGRRPVYSNQLNEHYKKTVDVYCLDELSVKDDINSALHCLFGQMNSNGEYECKDPNRFRKILAKKLFRKLHLPQTFNGIGMFVLRESDEKRFPIACVKREDYIKFITEKYQKLKGMETQVLLWLNHIDDYDNGEFFDPEDDDEWKEAWGSIGEPKKIKEQLLKEQENWKEDENLIDEYAKYILSPTGKLGLAELEMFAVNLRMRINVYKYHSSSFFKYLKTLSSTHLQKTAIKFFSPSRKYCILYEGDGRWRRLAPNNNLNLLCSELFSLQADLQIYNSEGFAQLKALIKENKNIIAKKDEVIHSVENFNPKNKTPDKLSQLLLNRINILNNDVEQTETLVSAICSLAEWVEYYNTGNLSPLFYLNIVENNEPNDWKFEFLLLELEERLGKPRWDNEDRENWRKVVREYLNSHNQALLLLTKIILKKADSGVLFTLNSEKLFTVLEELHVDDSILDDEDTSQLFFIHLFYKQKRKFWEKKFDDWLETTEQLKKTNKLEFVNLLLELEYKNDKHVLQSLINNEANETDELHKIFTKIHLFQGKDSASKPKTVDAVIAEMKEKDKENKHEDMMNKTEIIVHDSLKKANNLYETQHICNKIGKLIHRGVDSSEDSSLANFLCIFDYAVKLILGFQLRDTQRVAIITLLANGNKSNTLAQVSTGEGKSIIVAGVAIGFALCVKKKEKTGKLSSKRLLEFRFTANETRRNNKVDVITSNDVLAIRDSCLPVAKGGLKEIYEFFNVSVTNNCSRIVDERKKAYSMDVVYGQLANFQRDYLLDEFYNRNIRGDRPMVYGIIDEVDCMLLDRGNNMLYLSHDIPGMEMLESLYVFIWEKIRDHSAEMIKSEILYDLYGQIAEEDLKNIHAPLGLDELASERSAIWEHLIEKKVIDRQGRLLIIDVSKITEEKINYYLPKNAELEKNLLNPKIVFYFRKIAERKRLIRIPSHLLTFVDRHLDTWLDNAKRALLELKQDEDYVVDRDRSDTSPNLNPQVIIIDPDTGTDLSNSQWDGALHQFLQLKEGCKLTLQSLRAVFVSNSKYIKKYKNLAGVSGTLGSQPEQIFLEKLYKCDYITIPIAFPKRFSLKTSKLLKTKESWWKAITEETRKIIQENRSIVIFCRTIKEVNLVHKQLKSEINELRDNNKRIHRYTRDYEKFEFENSELDVGNVIVATNLAGRGTDIKISKNLEANGGLHVCLTYFAENERIEEQAMGRTARKGEPGSGILILCEFPGDQVEESGTSEEWGAEKIFVMKEGREWKERQRIYRLGNDFQNVEMLEVFIEYFTDNISVLKVQEILKKIKKEKNQGKSNIVQVVDDDLLLELIHNNTLDEWALWVDERDYYFKCFNLKQQKLKITLRNFNNEILTWMTPARRIAIAKHLATEKLEQIKGDQLINPTDILNTLIHSTDNIFYPTAYYYRAFILLAERKLWKDEFKEEKTEFVRMLRHTENTLNHHIDMQISFNHIHQSDMKPTQISSFCPARGYEEQKQNNIRILQFFLGSIQWLLGRHCSISDLRKAGSDTTEIDGFFIKNAKKFKYFLNNKKKNNELKTRKIRLEKVDENFSHLIKSKCIVCEFNDPDAIPSESEQEKSKIITGVEKRSKIILQIADDYGVSASLEEKLQEVFNENLTEEDIEKKLKEKIKIPRARKAFWQKLIEAEALIPSTECKQLDCVIMSEEQLESQTKLDRRDAITLDFGGKSFDHKTNRLYVLYNPTYESQEQLRAAKKLMFSKEHVKRKLLTEYSKRKENFETNKIAQLDLTKLKDVNLKSFGQLGKEDLLFCININRSERDGIWNELVNQEIINDQGYLVPSYDFLKCFSYPECPAYEDAVTHLVGKKLVVEIVRQQWLNSKDNPNCLKAINLLPSKPYRDMLGDLMAAHVISGARVSEDSDINVLEIVNNITKHDEERDCIMEYLRNGQAIYTEKSITPEYFLDFIEHHLKRDNVSSDELYVFRLVGLDRVINIKNRKWTSKRIFLASLCAPLVICGGLASMGVGVYLTYSSILSFGLCKNLFFMGGFSDILYAVETILSHKNWTWADYSRQKIRSALGKVEPIDAIKAIWKIKGSSNQSFGDMNITYEHRWRIPAIGQDKVQWSIEEKENPPKVKE